MAAKDERELKRITKRLTEKVFRNELQLNPRKRKAMRIGSASRVGAKLHLDTYLREGGGVSVFGS